MGIVFPREADPTMNLDVRTGGKQVRVAAHTSGKRHCNPRLLGIVDRRCCVPGNRPGVLDRYQHVCTEVLDGLEGPDCPPELETFARIFDRSLQAALGSAHLFIGKRYDAAIEGRAEHLVDIAMGQVRRFRHPSIEPHLAKGTCGVESR